MGLGGDSGDLGNRASREVRAESLASVPELQPVEHDYPKSPSKDSLQQVKCPFLRATGHLSRCLQLSRGDPFV